MPVQGLKPKYTDFALLDTSKNSSLKLKRPLETILGQRPSAIKVDAHSSNRKTCPIYAGGLQKCLPETRTELWAISTHCKNSELLARGSNKVSSIIFLKSVREIGSSRCAWGKGKDPKGSLHWALWDVWRIWSQSWALTSMLFQSVLWFSGLALVCPALDAQVQLQ